MKKRRNVLKYEVENEAIYVNILKYFVLSEFMLFQCYLHEYHDVFS